MRRVLVTAYAITEVDGEDPADDFQHAATRAAELFDQVKDLSLVEVRARYADEREGG